MRFDGHRYIHCKWCHGKGCVYCEGEADKAYKGAFPNGPEPILTFNNTPEDIAAARSVIHGLVEGIERLVKERAAASEGE